MTTSIEVLQSQVRQQRENVRVWSEGLKAEEDKLTAMRQALAEAEEESVEADGVTTDDGKE